MLDKFLSLYLGKILSTLGIVAVVSSTSFTSYELVKKINSPTPESIAQIPIAESLPNNILAQTTSQSADSLQLLATDPANQPLLTTAANNPETILELSTTDNTVPSQSQSLAPANLNPNSSSNQTLANNTTAFDSRSLALYDGRNGICYIAFASQVYDVTNHPAWNNCAHHGTRGGRDVTSIFPHPLSRLTGIPIVGSYQDNAPGAAVTPPSANYDDDDQDEDEYEYEDEDKNEIENEDEDDEHQEINNEAAEDEDAPKIETEQPEDDD